MTHPGTAILLVCLSLSLTSPGLAQETNKGDAMKDCPMHKANSTPSTHHEMVEKHGDEGMGFSHETTTHHFRLSPQGGVIEVEANDANDKPTVAAIRSHLSHIAVSFGQGNFSIPAFVHDGIPPGVTTMKLLKGKIQYQYEEAAAGGRVHIESSDPIAVAAIQDFLRFQINEHKTGDRLTLEQAQ
jgi:hypothetical protein